jgi:Holliday junction resolvasome RuvABC endonuclease subunit
MVNLGQINKKPKNILAIDASTNSIAFALFDDKKLIMHGKIKFAGNNTYQKVQDANRKLSVFFKEFAKGTVIVIEHTVFMNSPKTVSDLALVQGAIIGAAGINKIPVAGSVNPVTWQSFIGNKVLTKLEKKELADANPGKSVAWYKAREREMRKQKTINFINTYYDKNVNDDDVADAIAIGYWAINNWEKVDKNANG